MIVFDTKFGSRLLLPKLVCVLVLVSTGAAQESQLTQTIARLRASSDESTYVQAFEVGRNLVKAGQFKDAAALFEVLVEKRPRDFAVLYMAALANFNSGMPERAEVLIRRTVDVASVDSAVRAMPERAADAFVLMAVILAVRNNASEALKAAEQAVRLTPNSFDAQFTLGRALFGTGDYVSAVRAFRRAIQLNSADQEAKFFLATSLERSGDDAAALVSYRQLVAESPERMEGHLGVGVLLVKRGGASLEEGMKELRAALKINPNVYEARVTLGRALITTGRLSDAVEHLKAAADLAPDNPEPHYQLSLAYRRLGRKEDAAAESAIVKRIHESRRGTTMSKAPQRAH